MTLICRWTWILREAFTYQTANLGTGTDAQNLMIGLLSTSGRCKFSGLPVLTGGLCLTLSAWRWIYRHTSSVPAQCGQKYICRDTPKHSASFQLRLPISPSIDLKITTSNFRDIFLECSARLSAHKWFCREGELLSVMGSLPLRPNTEPLWWILHEILALLSQFATPDILRNPCDILTAHHQTKI